jgi:hypothetical protein
MTFKIRPLNEMIPIIMKAVEEDRMMDQIHRLQEQVEFERASLRSAFDELLERDNEIERLREALEIAADGFMNCGAEDLEDMCRAAIAKATGDE